MPDKFILSKEIFEEYNTHVFHTPITEDIIFYNLDEYVLFKNQIETNLNSFTHRNRQNPILLNKHKNNKYIYILNGTLFIGNLQFNIVSLEDLDEELSLFVFNRTLETRETIKVLKKDLKIFLDVLYITCDDILVRVEA